jgi:NAD(P)H-nitrite reductase large subunit
MENTIICRCEDITKADIIKILNDGVTDFEEIKRLLRIGMGPCQGNTCGQLVQREISNYLKISIEDVPTLNSRPLIVGVKLKAIKDGVNNEN